MTPDRDATLRAWIAELRRGSTRTWTAASADPAPTVPEASADPAYVVAPHAAQLEVVRRLDADVPGFARLADLVLTTPGSGRGAVDPPLPGVDARYGTPSVPPEDLPASELLRVAVAVIARLLRAGTVSDVPPFVLGSDAVSRSPQRRRRTKWPRRPVVLLGAPGAVRALAPVVRAHGYRPVSTGRRAPHLVLGMPLDLMVAQRWSGRVRAGGGIRWGRLWRAMRVHDRLPASIDVAALAAGCAHEIGAHRVHLVLGADLAEVSHHVAAVLSITLPTEVASADTAPIATDLLRRLNPLLTLLVGEARRGLFVEELRPHLLGGPGGTLAQMRPGVPVGGRRWARGVADDMVGRIEAAAAAEDYAVHGAPAVLRPRTDGAGSIDPDDVLDLALGVIVSLWSDPGPEEAG